jgi:hypothetical protein
MFGNYKGPKVKKNDKRITLDAKHNEMIASFKKMKKNLPIIKAQFIKYLKEYQELKKKEKRLMSIADFEKMDELKKICNNLKKQIIDIQNNSEERQYFMNVGYLLHDYHQNKKSNKKKSNNNDFLLNKQKENEKTEEISKYPSVLEFFDNREKKEEKSNKEISYNNVKISDFVTTEVGYKRADTLYDYLKQVDKNFVPKIEFFMDYDKCIDCNIEMTIDPIDGLQICDKCGRQNRLLIESDKPNFKDPPPEVSYFAYKRINHFNECLAFFQGKESTDVPQEVFDKILIEIKKERITNLARLDYDKIRAYLKKLKLNKYYDHIPHILNRINGLPPPVLSKQLEEKLRSMFKQIQNPFRMVCPKARKNFISYSYVLHKFVQLLGFDEFKSCFPLLKDRNKLHQTDLIWKGICKILGWKFIKSI